MADAVRQSPARAEPHDATAWLPLPDFAEMPPLDRLLVPDPEIEPDAPREVPVGLPSPARAEPHDATAWLPLPELDELPSVDALLEPDPTVTPPAPRDVPVGLPSPARAEPHDATAWLPLPELDPVPVASGNDDEPPRRHRRVRRFHLPYRALLTLAALTATGAAAYVGVTVLLDKGADVEIRVDGRLITAETGVATVGDLLAERGVGLEDYDRAVPDVSTPIENNLSVRVLRSFAVPVDFDGTPTVVRTTHHTPGDGFVADAADQLSPDAAVGVRDAPKRISDSTTVTIRTRKTGLMLYDGLSVEYDSPAHTVRELLEDYDVVLDDADVTSPIGLDEVLPTRKVDGSEVAIALYRVRNVTVDEDEVYTLPDEVRPDPTMQVTAPDRVEKGKPGLQRVTYLLIHRNGVVTDRVPTAYTPLDPAVPTITYFGTSYNSRWDKIAECETGTNWEHEGSGRARDGQTRPNVYQGGLGIWYGNWDEHKDDGWPEDANEATKYQQIIVAERIKDDHGWGAWGCAKTLGIAKEDGKRIR